MRADRARQRPRGITAVAVLVCLIIVTLVSGALLKLGLAHRDQVRAQERKLQVEWLAQSGIDRGLARLAAKADYSGETWVISPRDLDLPAGPGSSKAPAAVVVIKVERSGKAPGQRLIKVQADYPPDAPRRARHSNQILVELSSKKTGVAR